MGCHKIITILIYISIIICNLNCSGCGESFSSKLEEQEGGLSFVKDSIDYKSLIGNYYGLVKDSVFAKGMNILKNDTVYFSITEDSLNLRKVNDYYIVTAKYSISYKQQDGTPFENEGAWYLKYQKQYKSNTFRIRSFYNKQPLGRNIQLEVKKDKEDSLFILGYEILENDNGWKQRYIFEKN